MDDDGFFQIGSTPSIIIPRSASNSFSVQKLEPLAQVSSQLLVQPNLSARLTATSCQLPAATSSSHPQGFRAQPLLILQDLLWKLQNLWLIHIQEARHQGPWLQKLVTELRKVSSSTDTCLTPRALTIAAHVKYEYLCR